jgi:pyruvate dehydrogenase E2 component (dihydrolipoamide acetyltransferase)
MTEPAPRALRTQRLSRMRLAIARQMQQSLQSSAQLTLFRTVPAAELVEARTRLQAAGLRCTLSDLLLFVVSRVLPEHSLLNSTIDGEEVTTWESVNLGFAVALEEGLLAPVIKECQAKSLPAIAAAAADLAQRARSGGLGIAAVLDGTFTISNLGQFGVEHFTPIVNPPQVAILGIGRLGPAAELPLSLTIDHRVVDGAPGALFLDALARAIATPSGVGLEPEAVLGA